MSEQRVSPGGLATFPIFSPGTQSPHKLRFLLLLLPSPTHPMPVFPSQHLASFPSYSFSFPSSLSPPQPPPTPLNQSPIFSSLSGPSVKPRVIAFLHSCKSARLIFFISSRSLVTFFPVASLPGCPGNSSRLRRSFKLATQRKAHST